MNMVLSVSFNFRDEHKSFSLSYLKCYSEMTLIWNYFLQVGKVKRALAELIHRTESE